MASKPITPDELLTLLAITPQRLTALTTNLTPAQLRTNPSPDEWSPTEVLAHLRSCADVWGNCIRAIVAEDKPTIRAINPTTWIKRTDYPQLEFQPSLQAFTNQRAQLLAFLKSLPLESWSRTATLTGAGSPIIRTMESFVSRIVAHERPHIKQIERTVKTLTA